MVSLLLLKIRKTTPKTCRYFITFGTDIQGYSEKLNEYSDILRPQSCPLCGGKRPLRKHGSYERYLCDISLSSYTIDILRYYCPKCGKTVSFLPSFAIPHKQFSSLYISIVLQLIFICGSTFAGINVQYGAVSRQLAAVWVKNWYYSSTGIIAAMINQFKLLRQKAEKCSYHRSRYITETSLEAFFIVSDFAIGYELINCDGKCTCNSFSCQNRECSVILKKLQEELFRHKLNIPLL